MEMEQWFSHCRDCQDGGAEHEIGDITIDNSAISILIYEDYKTTVQKSNSVEFSLKVPLKFKEGEYSLGHKIIVQATEIDGSAVSWNINSVLIHKIDADEDSRLLGNAYFEINEYEYKISDGVGSYVKNKKIPEMQLLKDNSIFSQSLFLARCNGSSDYGRCFHCKK